MKKQMINLSLILKGMAMGIAEVIPGVSGGTIAFITGIYETLIDTIKAFDPSLISMYKKEGFRGVWSAINGNFLLNLLAGMALGVVVGVFGVVHLLKTYPLLLWAFFFGLIVASFLYIGRQVGKWNASTIFPLIVGALVAWYITVASPAQGNEALWFVFISGLIAISALMLPGISGSFMLLLMGMYTIIIPTVKDALSTLNPHSLLTLLAFGAGCLVGLVTFSRVLSWTFKRYHDQTMALLTGFVVGSLNKLWPWRKVLEYRENSRGELVPFIEKNLWPSQYEGDPMITGVLIAMIAGFLLVFFLEKMDPKTT